MAICLYGAANSTTPLANLIRKIQVPQFYPLSSVQSLPTWKAKPHSLKNKQGRIQRELSRIVWTSHLIYMFLVHTAQWLIEDFHSAAAQSWTHNSSSKSDISHTLIMRYSENPEWLHTWWHESTRGQLNSLGHNYLHSFCFRIPSNL